MATQLYKETIQRLREDYINLWEDEKRISFSFKEYLEGYNRWVEVGGSSEEGDEDDEDDGIISEDKIEQPEDILAPIREE